VHSNEKKNKKNIHYRKQAVSQRPQTDLRPTNHTPPWSAV